jgi:hypothetical protein
VPTAFPRCNPAVVNAPATMPMIRADFRFFSKRSPQHPLGDEREKAEGDPVIEGFNQVYDGDAGGPTQNRHQGLKKPEMPCQAKILSKTDVLQRYAGGDGHCESIHGKGYSDCDDVDHRPILYLAKLEYGSDGVMEHWKKNNLVS